MNSPLPDRLRSARKAANITQQQLGILIGMDPNTASARMNQYEKGRHSPDFSTAKRLAEELGVPVAFLYCDDDILAELILKIGRLSKEEQTLLLKTLPGKSSD